MPCDLASKPALRSPYGRGLLGLAVVALASLGCGTSINLGGGAPEAGPDAAEDAGREASPDGDPQGHQDAATCAALAPPDTSAPCEACDKGHSDCQRNGCFNGYFCDSSERDCKAPGTTCSALGAEAGSHG